jgi:hypothetical protein
VIPLPIEGFRGAVVGRARASRGGGAAGRCVGKSSGGKDVRA